jgi:hypothetical protein
MSLNKVDAFVNIKKIQSIDGVPILILHGVNDNIISVKHSQVILFISFT